MENDNALNEKEIWDIQRYVEGEIINQISTSLTVKAYEERLLEIDLKNPEFVRGYLAAIKDVKEGSYPIVHPSLYSSPSSS